jgi:general secretion pathway protein I
MILTAKTGGSRRKNDEAFTLLEVMIAVAIFFMAMFTILGVLSSSLHAAALLRTSAPTAGMVAAQLSITTDTNTFDTSSDSGDFGDIPLYDGYKWQWEKSEITTNGLLRFDITVFNPSGNVDSTLSVLFYCPAAKSSSLGLH